MLSYNCIDYISTGEYFTNLFFINYLIIKIISLFWQSRSVCLFFANYYVFFLRASLKSFNPFQSLNVYSFSKAELTEFLIMKMV